MRRIFKDWLHWNFSRGHFGYHRHGNCWRFKFTKNVYANDTVYTFWRFFISLRKPRKKTI